MTRRVIRTTVIRMRHVEGSRSQVYVACFELATTFVPSNDDEESRPTGRLRFRTRIASTQALSGGNLDEVSSLLLTIAHGEVDVGTPGRQAVSFSHRCLSLRNVERG